jgi:hypothetical protein
MGRGLFKPSVCLSIWFVQFWLKEHENEKSKTSNANQITRVNQRNQINGEEVRRKER